MLYIKLEVGGSPHLLANQCRSFYEGTRPCPCFGFRCPFLDLSCEKVTAKDWEGVIQYEEPADMTPKEAEEQRECCS